MMPGECFDINFAKLGKIGAWQARCKVLEVTELPCVRWWGGGRGYAKAPKFANLFICFPCAKCD